MCRPFAFVLAVFVLAACSAPRSAPDEPLVRGGVSLSADGNRFARLQPIRLTLANTGPISYEGGGVPCVVAERWSGRAWFRSDDDRRACVAMARRLSPGNAFDGTVRLDVPPGTYRLVHTMTDVGTDVALRVATRPFEIVPAAR